MKTKLLGLIALSVSWHVLAEPAATGEFVAHEWGTFTSVQGADGLQLEWNPFIKTDLPEFVYSRNIRQGGFAGSYPLPGFLGKGEMPSFVRMETPVIYFYSDQERVADVRVQFPLGRITEWYPQATRLGPYATSNKLEALQAGRSFIEWTGVKILAGTSKEISAGKLIRAHNDKGPNHYYAARETDANFLRMASPYSRTGVEYERDLFYRGVGFMKAPLMLALPSDENFLQLSDDLSSPLTDLFVVTIHDGNARFQYLDRLAKDAARTVQLDAVPFAPLSDVLEKIMREMSSALVRHGLYAKEANAMVNTWKDQWFAEEGVRVLYLLPRAWTDQTLPLSISPRPGTISRVMVGRAELITPGMEQQLSRQVTLYSQGDAGAKLQAVNEVRRLGLGRFLEPATRKMLGKNSDKKFAQAAWSLAQEASKEAESQTTRVVHQQTGWPLTTATKASNASAVSAYAKF
jgi:hypothetical protein